MVPVADVSTKHLTTVSVPTVKLSCLTPVVAMENVVCFGVYDVGVGVGAGVGVGVGAGVII